MATSLTQRRLVELARKLPKTSYFDPVASLDDLDAAAKSYAATAAYQGATSDWWRAWREIQRARGLDVQGAVAELNRSQRRWFALWGR